MVDVAGEGTPPPTTSPKMATRIDTTWITYTFLALALKAMIVNTLPLLSSSLGTSSTFDTSHLQLTPSDPLGRLRWDSIHFASVALDGYQYEQQLAFMPGWPAVLHLSGQVFRLSRLGLSYLVDFGAKSQQSSELVVGDILAGGGFLNLFASAGATMMLYKLTKHLTKSTTFANIATCFYLFPPTPAALSAPYTEPLYAFLTFSGFYFSSKSRWAAAALFLAIATSVRSTGIFSVCILGWQILFGAEAPRWRHLTIRRLASRALLALPACLIVVSPFVLFQLYAYLSFCSDPSTVRPWCSATIPLPYSFVQAEYWNVGFLTYWTPAQIPNLLLAGPVLILGLWGTLQYLRKLTTAKSIQLVSSDPTTSPALLPFHLHHLFLTLLLILNSHTQIALRVAVTDPVIWWNIAAIAFNWGTTPASKISLRGANDDDSTTSKPGLKVMWRRKMRMTLAGKVWVGWCVIWGMVSIVLWLGHYPPA